MQLRWTEEAATDLEQIGDYLFKHFPSQAHHILNELYEAPYRLLQFPYRGRPGRKPNTREMVLSPLPYLVIYTVARESIHVVRIMHGAQNWP